MDLLTWLLTLIVVGYTVALTVKSIVPLYKYRKVKERVIKINGIVESVYGEEKIKRKKEFAKSFYPVYECEVNGEKKKLSGLVRYIGESDNVVGREVAILYDKDTGDLWCEKDLPLMRRQIKIRLLTITILLIVMILTSVLL